MRLFLLALLAFAPSSAFAHCHFQYQVIGPGGIFYQLDMAPFRFLGVLPGGTPTQLGPVVARTEKQQLEIYHTVNVDLTATDLTGSVSCPTVSLNLDGPPVCTDDGAGGLPVCTPTFTITQTGANAYSCVSSCAASPQPHNPAANFNLPNAPAPPVTAVSPHAAMAGDPPDAIEIRGSGFVGASLAQWNGSPLPTVFIDATTLLALVPANLLASVGTNGVTVLNPGGASSQMAFAVLSSSATAGAPGAAPAPTIRVRPNPWKPTSGVPAVTFDSMPAGSSVKVFSMAARLVKTLDASSGTALWDLTNSEGQAVASGYYFYLVTSSGGSVHGRLALIR